jgi:hypothetical protein
MTTERIHITVDAELFQKAREQSGLTNDEMILDVALEAILQGPSSAWIDASYSLAYTRFPFDEPDEWGDLQSFSEAVAASHVRELDANEQSVENL